MPLDGRPCALSIVWLRSIRFRCGGRCPKGVGLSDVSGLWRSGCGGGGRLRRGKSGTGSLPSAQRGGKAAPGTVGVDVAWTDMTASGRSYTQRAEMDPTITMDYIQAVREVYAGGRDLTSPMLSPLFGNFEGFLPTLIQVGSTLKSCSQIPCGCGRGCRRPRFTASWKCG